MQQNSAPVAAAAVAAFDFDGTLTTRDTFLRFLAWKRSWPAFAVDLALTLPLLFLYAARLTGNDTHKMALFARQFAGVPEQLFRQKAELFAKSCVPLLIRSEALQRVRYHQSCGHRIVIVTASFRQWIAPWAATLGINDVLSSSPEFCEGRLTGRLAGPNCHGEEKVRRLLELFPNRSSYRLYAYGDSTGDRALLRFADEAFYRRFQ